MRSICWKLGSGLPLLAAFSTSVAALAGRVEVVPAEWIEGARGWGVTVTLRHTETGWDHCANAWRIISKSGQLLGEQNFNHLQVNEPPFTRNLESAAFPVGTQAVYIEGQDSRHGVNPQRLQVDMRLVQGERFAIQRLRP